MTEERMPQIWGYARVSTADQTVEPQVAQLLAHGVLPARLVSETVSGGLPALRRPGLAGLLGQLQAGDTLVTVKLDRLGRNPADTLVLLEQLEARGVGVRFLDLGADTRTTAGRLIVGILAQVAGWERDILRDRTQAGLQAARARGELLGRRHTLSPWQRHEARQMKEEGRTIREVARLLGCSTSVAQRAMTGTWSMTIGKLYRKRRAAVKQVALDAVAAANQAGTSAWTSDGHGNITEHRRDGTKVTRPADDFGERLLALKGSIPKGSIQVD